MFFCFTILKMIDIIFLKNVIDNKSCVNNKLWEKCRLFSGSPEQMGWLDASIPTHKTLFCVKSITYLNIVWGVNLKVISSFH